MLFKAIETLHIRIWKGFLLEKIFYRNNFSLTKITIFILLLIQTLVFSFSDVQSFTDTFLDNLIPETLGFIRDEPNNRFVPLAVIVIFYLVVWLFDGRFQNNIERELIESAVLDYVAPGIDSKLDEFVRNLSSDYSLSPSIRACIFLPVRIGFFQWRFQISCRSSRVVDSEMDLLLRFYEGAVGYSFLRNNINFINLSAVPPGYVRLDWENERCVPPGLKGVTILPSSSRRAIVWVLAIDTTDDSDLPGLQNPHLQNDAFNWMRTQQDSVELVWRLLKDGRQ